MPKCPVCGEPFDTARGVTIHWKKHTPEEEKAAKGIRDDYAGFAPRKPFLAGSIHNTAGATPGAPANLNGIRSEGKGDTLISLQSGPGDNNGEGMATKKKLSEAIKEKFVEPIKTVTMRWPDKPWNQEQPQRYDGMGRRMGRIQEEEQPVEVRVACCKCGGPASRTDIFISRRYGSERAPYWDRWQAKRMTRCIVCGVIYEDLTDEEIDKTYQRRD